MLGVYLLKQRMVVQFAVACAAAVLLGSMPFLIQDPGLIARHVLGYESFYGHWGTARLMTIFADVALTDDGAPTNPVYGQVGRMLAFGLIVVASVMMGFRKSSAPIFAQCGVIAFLFMAFSPGFGIQYLAWLVPWVVAFGLWPTAHYYATSGVFAFAVYTYWSQGLPWYFADAREHVPDWWPPSIVALELLCWLSVVVVLCQMMRMIVAWHASTHAPAALVHGDDHVGDDQGRRLQTQRTHGAVALRGGVNNDR